MEITRKDLKISKTSVGDMTIEMILVQPHVIQYVMEKDRLTNDTKLAILGDLIDVNPDWDQLSKDDQASKVQIRLMQKNIIEWLKFNNIIRKNCMSLSASIEKSSGEILVEAYYPLQQEGNRATRRGKK